MKKYKLTKVQSNHQNLRTDEIVGKIYSLPKINQEFIMFSESLTEPNNPLSYRKLTTSLVKSVTDVSTDFWLFHTNNSIYALREIN